MVIKLVARESPAHRANCAPPPDDVIFQVGAMLTDRDSRVSCDGSTRWEEGGGREEKKKDRLGSARVMAVIAEKNP